MLRWRGSGKSRGGNVSVEFALVASFVLLPFTLGATDFLSIISAQAQLNSALQSLYYFAFANPSSANNTTYVGYILTLINNASIYQITLPTTMSSGVTNASLSYGCFTPPSTTITYQTTTCSTGQTQQTLVTYQVQTSVALPFPLPGFSNPMTLTATGEVQVQ